MIYPHLPPVGALDAPELTFEASPNVSSRNGTPASVVFEHVWGGGDLAGVVAWLTNPQSQASAHLVYAGRTGPDSGKAVQLVPWGMKAWT